MIVINNIYYLFEWGSYKIGNVAIIEKIPTVKEYIQLRNSIGWNILQFDKI